MLLKVLASKLFQMKQNMVQLRMHRSNETALVSEIPSIINDESAIIAPGQGKKLV